MWTGYSYFMVGYYSQHKELKVNPPLPNLSEHLGQRRWRWAEPRLPGSCLEEFRAQPVIECHGHGRCNYYDALASFWLTVIEEQDQFVQPRQQTLKADFTSKISRWVT